MNKLGKERGGRTTIVPAMMLPDALMVRCM